MPSSKPLLVPLLAALLAAPLLPAAAGAGGYGNADRLSGYHRGGHGYGWDHRDTGHHARNRHDRHGHHAEARPRSSVRIWLGDGLSVFWNAGYVGSHGHDHLFVGPAIGTRVRHVPAGYVSFAIGTDRYFAVGGTFYVRDDRHRDYLVVPKPRGADAAMRDAAAEREELFADSAFDRNADVREWDRSACDAWALSETGGVERSAPGSPGRRAYLRAMEACLEGRGYEVK